MEHAAEWGLLVFKMPRAKKLFFPVSVSMMTIALCSEDEYWAKTTPSNSIINNQTLSI
jgi:hypothetical protein